MYTNTSSFISRSHIYIYIVVIHTHYTDKGIHINVGICIFVYKHMSHLPYVHVNTHIIWEGNQNIYIYMYIYIYMQHMHTYTYTHHGMCRNRATCWPRQIQRKTRSREQSKLLRTECITRSQTWNVNCTNGGLRTSLSVFSVESSKFNCLFCGK